MKSRYSIVDLPLHHGNAPRYLFKRMVGLATEIVQIIEQNYGKKVLMERLSNGFWFQCLGCVLGFDWHSSGLTTTTCGALAVALHKANIGITTAGGKGKAHLIQNQIEQRGLKLGLSSGAIEEIKHKSRLAAKIDGSCIQDSYEIYHHSVFFDEKGNHVIIQQGMNKHTLYARRYHWGDEISISNYNREIASPKSEARVLNLNAKRSEKTRALFADLISDKTYLRLPAHHIITQRDLDKKTFSFFNKLAEYRPKTFEEVLLTRGMGPKKLRALTLVAKLIYGTDVDWKDPVKYTYAHGGKDGTPYPVDRKLYDQTIEFFREVSSNTSPTYKKHALKRLTTFFRSH